MTVLSDPSLWRFHPQSAIWQVYVHNPATLLSGSVNQAEFLYPLVSVEYDDGEGSSGAVVKNMTIQFLDADGNHKGFARANAADSDTLTFYPFSQGDIDLQDDDTFRVLNDYRIWAKIPRILPDGTVYKDWDVSPLVPPPVAVIKDGWFACEVEDDGSKQIVLDGTGSFAVTEGAFIDTYQWDVLDGTIDIGSTSTDTITATFEPGSRWISLAVTDNNGASHITRILVSICSPSVNPAMFCEIAEVNNSVENGAECSIKLLEEAGEILEGSPIIVFAKEFYGDDEDFAQGNGVKFCGYAVSDELMISPYLSDFELKAVGPKAYLNTLPSFSVVVERVETLSTWFTMPALNAFRFIHHILQWHSNILSLFPLEQPLWSEIYPTARLQSGEGSLSSQLEFLINGVAAKLTASARGELYLRKFPQLMMSSERAGLVDVLALTDDDWVESITLQRTYIKPIHTVRAMMILADPSTITVVATVAPGQIPGQGSNQEALNEGLVGSQSESNERVGKLYAYRNSGDNAFTITVINQGNAIDPAWQEPFVFSMEVDNKRALEFSEKQFIVLSVTTQFNSALGVCLENWEVIPLISDSVPQGLTQQLPGAEPPLGDDPYLSSDGFLIDPLTTDPYPGPTWSLSPPIPYEQSMPVQAPYVPAQLGGGKIISINEKIQRYKTSGEWLDYYTAKEVISFAYGSGKNGYLIDNDGNLLYVSSFGSSVAAATKNTIPGTLLLRPISGISSNNGVAGYGYQDGNYQVFASTNRGNDVHLSDLGAQSESFGFDTDDFNLGIWIAAASGRLYFINGSYTDTSPDYFDDADIGPLNAVPTRAIRIPYRKLESQARNNDPESFQFLYAMGDGNAGETLYRMTVNLVLGTILQVQNITPFADGIVYAIVGANAIETYGANSEKIVVFGKKAEGGSDYFAIDFRAEQGSSYAIVGGCNTPTVTDVDWATYTPGVGWEDMNCINGNPATPSSIYFRRMRIYFTLPGPSTVTYVRYKWSGDPVEVDACTDVSTFPRYDFHVGDGTAGDYIWVGVRYSVDTISIILETSGTVGSPPTGSWVLEEVEVHIAVDIGEETHLLASSDGGQTWEDKGAYDGNFVHFVQPNRGGNGNKLLLSGPSNVWQTSDFCDTIVDITEDIDVGDITEVFKL